MRRLTIMLATVAALLLVPAASAFGAEELHLTIAGSGAGEVTSGQEGEFEGEPPIACNYESESQSGVCDNDFVNKNGAEEESYEEFGFRAITLNAAAAPGSKFMGWTTEEEFTIGGCGPEPLGCSVGALTGSEEDRLVKALFCLEGETQAECETAEGVGPPLTVEIVEGSGGVHPTPVGRSCTGTAPKSCTTTSLPAGAVTLKAEPASGYIFGAWSGCATHVGLSCGITLAPGSKPVKVKFVKAPTLTVTKAGSGFGKIGASGISCDEGCSTATSRVKEGTAVTVKAAPTKGSTGPVFEGGTGSASGCSGEVCTFTLTENSSVNVKFTPIPTKTLTVNLTGPAFNKGKVSGKGIVVKGLTSSKIGCGAGCTSAIESFFSTDTVELVAVASTGYTFEGWNVEGGSEGTCTGKTTPCTLLSDANKTITAEFK